MNRKKLTILAIFFLAIIIFAAERHKVSAQGGCLPNKYTNQVFLGRKALSSIFSSTHRVRKWVAENQHSRKSRKRSVC